MSEHLTNGAATSAASFDPQDRLAFAWREAALGSESYEQHISEFQLIVNAARNTWPGRQEEFNRAIDVIQWTEFKEFERPVPEGMLYEEQDGVYLQIAPEETLQWLAIDAFEHLSQYDSAELFKRRRRNEYAARDGVIGQAIAEVIAATPMAQSIRSIISEQNLVEVVEAPLSHTARIIKTAQMTEAICKEHNVPSAFVKTDALAVQRIRSINSKLDNLTENRKVETRTTTPPDKFKKFLARLFESRSGAKVVAIHETEIIDGIPKAPIKFTDKFGTDQIQYSPSNFNEASTNYFYSFKGDKRYARTFDMQNLEFFRDALQHYNTWSMDDWRAIFGLWKDSAKHEFQKYLYDYRKPGVVPLGIMPAEIPDAPVESVLLSGYQPTSRYISAEQQEKDKEKIVAEVKIEGKQYPSYFLSKFFTGNASDHKRETTESTTLRIRSVRSIVDVAGFRNDRNDDAHYQVYLPYKDQQIPRDLYAFSGKEVQEAFAAWGFGEWAATLGSKKSVSIEDIEQYIIKNSKYVMPATDKAAQKMNEVTTDIRGVRFEPKRRFRRQKLEVQCSGASTLMDCVLGQLGVVSRRITGYSVQNGQTVVTEADAHQIVGVFTKNGEYYFDPTPRNARLGNYRRRKSHKKSQIQRLNTLNIGETHAQRIAENSPHEIVQRNRTILLSQISEAYGSPSAADLFVRLKRSSDLKSRILRETMQIISRSAENFDNPEFVKVLEQKITSFENIKQATVRTPDKKRQAIVDEILPLLQSTHRAVKAAQRLKLLHQK